MISDLNCTILADLIKKIGNDSGASDYANTIALKNVYDQIISDLVGDTGILVDSDIQITDPTKGLVFTDIDGTQARLTLITDEDGDPQLILTAL